MTAIYRFAEAVRPTEGHNQSIKQPANQSKQSTEAGFRRTEGGDTGRQVCRVQASDGRAPAQALCARSGLAAELLPQPESVNMFLFTSRAETLTLGQEGGVWPGSWPNSDDPSHKATRATRATRHRHQAADRRPPTSTVRQADSIAGKGVQEGWK